MIKRSLAGAAAIAVCLALSSTARSAITMDFDTNGTAAGGVITDVQTFDYTPGNALADGGLDAIRTFILTGGAVEAEFDTYFHAKLGVFSDENADPIFSYAPGTAEITIVAGFREKVVDVTTGTSDADFEFAPGGVNFLEVYYDDFSSGVLASAVAGTGYNDGHLILSATITDATSQFDVEEDDPTEALDQVGTNTYPAITTVIGQGTTELTAKIGTLDEDFFIDFPAVLGFIRITIFNTSQILPFEGVNPSARFAKAPGGVAPVIDGAGSGANTGAGSIGPVNGELGGVGNPDVQFQVDANQQFDYQQAVVPEPTTFVMWGLGLATVGLVHVVRRRRLK